MSKKHVAAGAAAVAMMLTTLGSAVATPAFAGERPPEPRGYTATADLDGRDEPALNATYVHNFVNEGDVVHIICQTTGQTAYGSRIWDLVADGAGDPTVRGHKKFVPDRFIRTGTDGFAHEIPRCSKTEIELAKD
jgi:hypothetical protein